MAFHREIDASEWRWIIFATTILLVILTVPFIWAYAVGGPEYHFMGALINPVDGLSYQARMVEGMDGGWRFHLPYTPEEHKGLYLYTFYLLLGHASRLLGAAPIMLFHTARLVGAAMMYFALYRFIADWTASVQQRRITWVMAGLGGGLGWIAMAFGYLAPDILQLPEAYPLQAAYANAHFPWGITCMLVVAHVLTVSVLDDSEMHFPGLDVESVAVVAAVVFLASTSPFPLLPLGLAYGLLLVWLWVQNHRPPLEGIAWGAVVVVFALPFIAYSMWATSAANPLFHEWYSQNVTLSPPVWAYVIGFGPLLALALIGIVGTRNNLNDGDVFLLAWLICGALILYAPVNVQRRFSMGLVVPLAIYAGRGLWRIVLPGLNTRWRAAVEVIVFTLIMPSTVFALLLPMLASLDQMAEGGGPYFVSRSEERAMQWLAATGTDALVLASPATSLFLPAYGQRVVCGHPMETVRSAERVQAVMAYYEGETCSVVATEDVDYIWVGPREWALADPDSCTPAGTPLYDNGDVAIYAASDH